MQPAQPEAPAPPATAATTVDRVEVAGAPRTLQELVALRARRSELSNQLQSAASRRRNLADQLKSADEGARTGLLERIAVLDRRIVQLESDIELTGRQLTNASAGVIAAEGRNAVPEEVFVIGGVFTVFVLFPLAVGAARMMWKRSTVRPAPVPADTLHRLERIEQAVEAVAIEVERVSEGQRFVTRLLSERGELAALPAGHRDREGAQQR